MDRKKLWLVLAVGGAIVPYVFLIQHFADAGLGLSEFIGAAFANPVAGGLTADLLISSLVFWIYMLYRRTDVGGPKPLMFIVLNVFIGLSCALPAYLYACEEKNGN